MPFVTKNSHWLLITIGTIIWSLTMVKSGLVYDYGMGFWGANGHDGVWHISLITSLAQGSFQMPIFASEAIKNYHLGFDLLVAAIHVVTRIPAITLYFQILPPLLAFGVGYSAYLLVWDWTKSQPAALWAVFFTYFGGSWGWLFGGGESMFWSQQAISTLINPPFALSLILILMGLIYLNRHKTLAPALFFALAGFTKIYAGLLVFSALLFLVLLKRVPPKVLVLFIILFLVLFLPFNHTSGSLIVFQPGWFLETMMGLSDRLNWPRFYSAMTNYRLGHNWPKAALAYFVAFAIFWFGNMGTRAISLLRYRRLSTQDLFFWIIIILGSLVPMLFLQSGTPWNTIQFFYYSQFLAAILAGISIANLKTNKLLEFGIWSLVIALTLPTTLDSLKHYLPSRPPAMVSRQELDALNFLSSLPRGIVLTSVPVINPSAPPPRPLYHYESTAYVSALSGQPVFVEDYVNLNITGFDWQSRRDLVTSFFTSTDPVSAKQFLTHNNIKYIYLENIASNRPVISVSQLGGTTLFENSQSAIWQLN